MNFKIVQYLLFFSTFTLIYCKINFEFIVHPESNKLTIEYSGYEEREISSSNIDLFHIDRASLIEAVGKYFGKEPDNVHWSKPAMCNGEEVYKKYNWKPVTKVVLLGSIQVKSFGKKQVIISKQKFENYSNVTIKVNTGLSHTVQNTLTTSWQREREYGIEQEFDYGVDVVVAKLEGATRLGYITKWGSSEEKSETVTIGTTSGAEVELRPGQAVTAVLSASTIELSVEVTYLTYLRNYIVAVYGDKYKDHYIWGFRLDKLMEGTGLNNSVIETSLISIRYNIEGSLKVFDRVTDE